jgi:hypothetical protein
MDRTKIHIRSTITFYNRHCLKDILVPPALVGAETEAEAFQRVMVSRPQLLLLTSLPSPSCDWLGEVLSLASDIR